MFFSLTQYDKSEKRVFFPKTCKFECDNLAYTELLLTTFDKMLINQSGTPCESVCFKLGFPKRVKDKIRSLADSEEAYAIEIGKKTVIYSGCERGFIYALMMLYQLTETGELFSGFIYDFPVCETRGYRVFLPARAGFDDFKKMVDLLAYYKFNSIILEIGGAMQYERHPEINERWAEFCKETHAYSGRTHEIQHKTYPWEKNSIHTDNAEGDIITQDECRMLAAYCRSRGLEVIPECPTLSHCDYLVMAHPEIREREGDAYPDTYCPGNPDSYKLVFDILEEVIAVFTPDMINIGHDEAYSISICPKCRKTPAPVTYANDVKKIHAFLKERGIKTLMWGEKLLNARLAGKPVGGAGHGKGLGKIHALFRCRDLLPRDITMLNWYYGINPDYDKIYHERGFKMLFGNLNALNAKDWDKRIKAGAKGGFVSNWGSFREEYMQRNLQYFALTITAYAFWCEDYEANGNEKNVLRTAKELYRLKCKNIKNKLTVTHTCDYEIAFKFFYDGEFIIDEDYTLGSYLITYSDGQTETLPVKYGTNIGRYEYENYANNASFRSTLYSTLPKKFSDGFAYEAVYEDPRPDAELVSIVYQPKEKMKNVKVNLLAFSRSKAARGDRAESILNDNVSKDELIFA